VISRFLFEAIQAVDQLSFPENVTMPKSSRPTLESQFADKNDNTRPGTVVDKSRTSLFYSAGVRSRDALYGDAYMMRTV